MQTLKLMWLALCAAHSPLSRSPFKLLFGKTHFITEHVFNFSVFLLFSLFVSLKVVLNGNPVSFHPSYRKIVVNSLHPAVIPQVSVCWSFTGHLEAK